MPKFAVMVTVEVVADEIGTAIGAVTHAIASHDVGEVTQVHAHPQGEPGLIAPVGGIIAPGDAPGPFGLHPDQIQQFAKALMSGMREADAKADKPWEEGEGA